MDAMFEEASTESHSALSSWMSRGAVSVAFIFFGVDKFSPGWVQLFQQIGIGQWFRYFTGVGEHDGLRGSDSHVCDSPPQDSVFSVALLIGLIVF
jgi:hypothetical protein